LLREAAISVVDHAKDIVFVFVFDMIKSFFLDSLVFSLIWFPLIYL